MRKTRFAEVGAWTTLERLWGRKGRAVFVGPARAEIKVRYGNGRGLGADLQRQTLDGLHARELRIGRWSLDVRAHADSGAAEPRGRVRFLSGEQLAINPYRK